MGKTSYAMKYALACAILFVISGHAHAQLVEEGDTLVLSFEDSDRLPYYRPEGKNDVEIDGELNRYVHMGDTLIIGKKQARLYYFAEIGDSTIVVGGISVARVGTNMRKIRERERLAKVRAEQRRERAAWVQSIKDAGIPILIGSVRFFVNSAGGVVPAIRLQNISNRRLKYITFNIVGYNAVGDPVASVHTGATTQILRLVGPVEPNEYGDYDYEDAPPWYARTTHCLEVRKVAVEFMEGGSYMMVNDLKKAREHSSDYKLQGECST